MHYRAYLEDAWRLILSQKEITKGKNKGKHRCTYRSSATQIKQIILGTEKLVQIAGDEKSLDNIKSYGDK